MADTLEIPLLQDVNLMEVAVCGHLRTNKTSVRRSLNALKGDNVARVGGRKSNRYLEVFGSGKTNHLHVEVIFRSQKWTSGRTLRPLDEIANKIIQFTGIPIDASITGKFYIPLSELPEDGLIRSSMDETTRAGITARKTGQTLSMSDGPVKELAWSLVQDDEDLVEVEIVVSKEMVVHCAYLQECENLVVRAFHALIVGANSHAAT